MIIGAAKIRAPTLEMPTSRHFLQSLTIHTNPPLLRSMVYPLVYLAQD